MTNLKQAYLGSWPILRNGETIGVVQGDFVIGFVARDERDRVLGHYPTYERALYAVLHR